MLSDQLQSALKEEYLEHGACKHADQAHCFNLIIAGAAWRSEEEVEDEEQYNECVVFIMDEMLSSLILRGYIEPAGMNEDGEFTYQATEMGVEAINDDPE